MDKGFSIYRVVENTHEIYLLCLRDELYLRKGLMLEALDESRMKVEQCRAVFYSDGSDGYQAVCVLVPGREDEVGYFTGMLYVKRTLRGTGIAQALVKRGIALAGERVTRWQPWDMASGIFFQRLLDSGVLSEENFTPYRLRILSECQRLLASGLAKPR